MKLNGHNWGLFIIIISSLFIAIYLIWGIFQNPIAISYDGKIIYFNCSKFPYVDKLQYINPLNSLRFNSNVKEYRCYEDFKPENWQCLEWKNETKPIDFAVGCTNGFYLNITDTISVIDGIMQKTNSSCVKNTCIKEGLNCKEKDVETVTEFKTGEIIGYAYHDVGWCRNHASVYTCTTEIICSQTRDVI